MEICGGTNIKIGDNYSVRQTSVIHWYIEVKSKKKNGDPCIFTMGLNMNSFPEPERNKLITGQTWSQPEWAKTIIEIQTPDISLSKCNNQILRNEGLSPFWCNRLKFSQPFGYEILKHRAKLGRLSKKKLYARGQIVTDLKSSLTKGTTVWSGIINQSQLDVIRFLKMHGRYFLNADMKTQRL